MSFSIERVAAKLEPFDFTLSGSASQTSVSFNEERSRASDVEEQTPGQPLRLTIAPDIRRTSAQPAATRSGGALGPIYSTGGLVFPYPPSITEGLSVRYDSVDLTHSNESVHAYRNTDNVRLTLSDCVWTCDTFENAVYALSVLHFLRSYSYMDFGQFTGRNVNESNQLNQDQAPGRGKKGSGRPPSPMWFSAYGNFVYNRVPVLMEKVDISFPKDETDYVGIPDPGTTAYKNQQLQRSALPGITGTSGTGKSSGYSWMPIKFQVGSISLVVQHSIRYWTREFSLEDFYSGEMVKRNSTGKNLVGRGL